MLDLKKWMTKVTKNLIKSVHVSQSVSFATGMNTVTIPYTLPTGAEIVMLSIRRHTNPDWIHGYIATYSNTSVLFSYQNTYTSAISGSIELDVLYK